MTARGQGAPSSAADKRCPLATPSRLEGTRRASIPPIPPLVGLNELVVLELVTFGSALGAERPASSVEFPGAARIFDDAVQRHELRHDYPSHVKPPRMFRPWNC